MSKPFILFITGTSASGKTTLYKLLQKDPDLKHVIFHDIDENGVPQVGLGPWRSFRVEELLYNATENYKKGLSTVICGVSFPHEVIDSKYYKPKYNVDFMMVKAPLDVVRTRLEKRAADPLEREKHVETLSKKSWAGLLKSTKELLLQLNNSFANQKNGYVINTISLSIEQMYGKAQEIIFSIAGIKK